MQVRPPLIWTRTELASLASIAGIGLLLRLIAAALLPSPLESDYLGYWTMATNLYGGRGLSGDDGQPTAFLNVGYPVFLCAVFNLLGPTISAVKAANVVLGVVTIVLVHVAARQMFGSRQVAVLASLLVATYFEAVAYTSYAAKENLVNVLVMAQLALVTRQIGQRPWVPSAALFGLLTGCIAAVGNAGLSLLPGMVLQVARATRRGAFVGYLLVAALLAGAAVAPLLYRNNEVFGAYVLNNNGGFNLYIGNNPNSIPYFQSITETPLAGEWKELRARLGEHGTDVFLRQLAIQHIIGHPGDTLLLALRKGVAFWEPPTHTGRGGNNSAVETAVRFVWLVEFCAICGLALLTVLRWRIHWRPLVVLAVLVAGYTAVHMVFYVSVRYRLPIMPVLCVGAGLGVSILLGKVVNSRMAGFRVLERIDPCS